MAADFYSDNFCRCIAFIKKAAAWLFSSHRDSPPWFTVPDGVGRFRFECLVRFN